MKPAEKVQHPEMNKDARSTPFDVTTTSNEAETITAPGDDARLAFSDSLQVNISLPTLSASFRHSIGVLLEPINSSGDLPLISLKPNETVAIGRGRDAFERLSIPSSPRAAATKQQTDIDKEDVSAFTEFIEVADGRISRLHCIVSASSIDNDGGFKVILKDFSSNGTFINGTKVNKSSEVVLFDGDRVSLVLSVAPLAEVGFILRRSRPHSGAILSDGEDRRNFQKLVSGSRPETPAESTSSSDGMHEKSKHTPTTTGLKRSSTSTYVTPEIATVDDLQCQICLDSLRNAVAIDPCGHSFCATCLSQHMGALLRRGGVLQCPFRCGSPRRVIVNDVARRMVDELVLSSSKKSHLDSSLATSLQVVEEEGEVGDIDSMDDLASQPSNRLENMHALVPMDDSNLPLSLINLKSSQIERAIRKLDAISESPEQSAFEAFQALNSMEYIARLAWSDDEVRNQVREAGGIESILAIMENFMGIDTVQCSACLALMSLVRGESEASSTNRWYLVGDCQGAIQLILEAMRRHSRQPMVQLSGLLILIPVALEDETMVQWICNAGALSVLISAVKNHINVAEVVGKALLAMGALSQGENSGQVIESLISAGLPRLLTRVLKIHGSSSEEILWSVLFVLAVIARDPSENFTERVVSVASAGISTPLGKALESYKTKQNAVEGDSSDMITTAGDFVMQLLERAEMLIFWRRLRAFTGALTVGMVAYIGLKAYRRIKGLPTRTSDK